ncbi:Gfo/Idh/MocA family protein [Lichenihabitans psoromatis]|uniref:Gfo/Idh/MocA family protein n=1 Tax=Lichenihabitans psoromatis TaxID=2528642 RepID=UPI0010384F6F|nr:Gfo/Idh/MocA family oxidoreductase [Lichenihabitans psoromatis]
MSDLTRRTVLGASAGLLSVGLTQARAAEVGTMPEDPHAIGTVTGSKVELPPLHAASEAEGPLPNPDPFTKRLGVAVVGLGHLSLGEILPGFGQSKSVKVVALVSGHREKARAVAAEYNVPERALYDYASFDSIKNNPEIDFVYIVLPNAMHLEFVTRAAQAGKHVLCEKPMATTSADAELMIAACRDAKVKLMIAYRMQYEATQRAAMAMVRKKEIGELRLIQAVNGQNDTPGQWRQVKAIAGGGSLPDVGIYCYNAFRYLTGEEPVEVTGRMTQPTGDPRFSQVEDLANFTLQFPSGVMGVGTSGYSIHEARALKAMGTTGWIGLYNAFAYNNIAMTVSRKDGEVNGIDHRQYPPKSQFATEMDHFADAIRRDVVPHTPGEEGLQDIRIMEAIYRAAEGGSPVKMPLVQGLDTTRGPAPATEG